MQLYIKKYFQLQIQSEIKYLFNNFKEENIIEETLNLISKIKVKKLKELKLTMKIKIFYKTKIY